MHEERQKKAFREPRRGTKRRRQAKIRKEGEEKSPVMAEAA